MAEQWSVLGARANLTAMAAQVDDFLALSVANDLPVSISVDATQWWESAEHIWNWWNASRPSYNPANIRNVEWTVGSATGPDSQRSQTFHACMQHVLQLLCSPLLSSLLLSFCLSACLSVAVSLGLSLSVCGWVSLSLCVSLPRPRLCSLAHPRGAALPVLTPVSPGSGQGWDPEKDGAEISWRNWGSQFRITAAPGFYVPPPNFAAPAFREAAAAAMLPLVARIAAWYAGLPADKKYLLAYVRKLASGNR